MQVLQPRPAAFLRLDQGFENAGFPPPSERDHDANPGDRGQSEVRGNPVVETLQDRTREAHAGNRSGEPLEWTLRVGRKFSHL